MSAQLSNANKHFRGKLEVYCRLQSQGNPYSNTHVTGGVNSTNSQEESGSDYVNISINQKPSSTGTALEEPYEEVRYQSPGNETPRKKLVDRTSTILPVRLNDPTLDLRRTVIRWMILCVVLSVLLVGCVACVISMTVYVFTQGNRLIYTVL